MEYFKFQDPRENLIEPNDKGLLEKFLLLFIPRANPDYDKIIPTVGSWYIEYDRKGNYPNREVGFDKEGKPIIAMPTNRNHGYWTDNNLKYEDFINSFNTESITKKEFEDAWNKVELTKKHQPYDVIKGHQADFRVKYQFYKEEEGGRKAIPFQGYRPDFWYDIAGNGIVTELFMIWPEFEDDKLNVILNNDSSVPERGTARMWIVVPERRNFHLKNIKVGLRGFFMEANRKVAECEVIEILGLSENPKE